MAAAVLVAAAALAVPAATASPHMLVGIVDDANTLNFPEQTFGTFRELRAQVARINLSWQEVSPSRPAHLADPADPAYRWGQYDAAISAAAKDGVQVLLSIVRTPGWENGRTFRQAPSNPYDLRAFAYAAARRYSGTFTTADGTTLPAVRLWLAWNEPNNPIDLAPQYRRVGGRWIVQSAIDYARICNAVYDGVHATALAGEKVACGATSPRGNDAPTSSRPSVAPLTFLAACKRYGLRRFDVWAHHPYNGSKLETPTSRPSRSSGAITLGNLGVLLAELTQLYGPKHLWITEYGWQTNPPDPFFGVSWAQQAAYLSQSFGVARRNPRVDMMLWFLLKDDVPIGGFQSGLETAGGRRKPAFSAFARLPH